MPFGQVVIGPPGAGKTTYCRGLQDFLTQLGRKVAVVNLDPANDTLPYTCKINLAHLITLDDVMNSMKLGPNGAMIYCMEFLEKNLDWLKFQLDKHKDHYFLFDCPGQVELYTHNTAVRNIMQQLVKWDHRLCAVHLVDSHYCADPSKFIAVLLTSLSTMLQIELPHVNILSKVDLIEKYDKLSYNIDFYTEVLDLEYLLDHLGDDPFVQKFRKLNKAICGVVQDYSLVSFLTLNIQDKESVLRTMKEVDKANGYCFGDLEQRNILQMMSSAVGADFEYAKTSDVRENYMGNENDDDSMDASTL